MKSPTISFLDTQYFTANSAEGTLASYGKTSGKNFDRFGHIRGVEFDLPRNSWKQRYAVNAAALVGLAGKGRFSEFAGVEFEAAVQDRRQIEVTFVGSIVPKDQAIRCLNADIEALEYLDTLNEKRMRYEKDKLKLFKGAAPPKPKIVLANVVMLNGQMSQALDASGSGSLSTVIRGIGGGLKVARSDGQQIAMLSPVVRCYRTYSIEFKPGPDGKPQRFTLADQRGAKHIVPQVFDLTPDL